MSYALARLERIYLQIQSAFGTVPNSTGTATVGNSNACRFMRATLENMVAPITRPDKTGTLSRTQGGKGRTHGSWSVEMSLAPNGVAGVKPDSDPIIQSVFGAAGAVTTATAGNGFPSGTGVVDGAAAYKYTLNDAIIPFAFWDFRQPSTIDQRLGVGCVPTRMTFNLGQDGASTTTAEGECMGVLSSNQFVSTDAQLRAGLTAFPVEPASPVTNGGLVPGFVGKAIINGTEMLTLRNASIEIAAGGTVVKDTFGYYRPVDAERDARVVSNRFSLYEDDTAAFITLEAAALAQTAIDTVYVCGTVPGSMVVLHCKGVQVQAPKREEERRFTASFSGEASASTLALRDELTLWFV